MFNIFFKSLIFFWSLLIVKLKGFDNIFTLFYTSRKYYNYEKSRIAVEMILNGGDDPENDLTIFKK